MSLFPLADARVVDTSTGIAGPLCGKLLADAGASVTKVEFPGKDPARKLDPAPHWFDFLNLGKSLVSVDPATQEGREELEELLATSDLYMTSAIHRTAASGFDCDSVLRRHSDLLAACVTPFGQTGPYVSFAADDFALSALSGLADATPGFPDHQLKENEPPVQSLAPLTEVAGALTAACALFGPLAARLRGDPGPRHVEVAVLEAAVSMMVFEWGTTAYGGGVRGRRPIHDLPEPNCYLPCQDGDVVIVAFRDNHWDALVELMGDPGWASDPVYRNASTRTTNRGRLHDHLRAWTRTRRGRDILEAAQAKGLPCAPWLELSETIASEHVRSLRSLRSVEGRVFPADPVVIDGVRREVPPTLEPVAQNRWAAARPSSGLPLAGVRVVDLTHIVAGPFCGQLLAALGAEVILVESTKYLVSRSFGPFVGKRKHDGSMIFNHVNRGKRSVQIDLTSERGQRVLRDLVKSADVVLENLSRRAVERLHLTYPELAGDRNDLILGSLSGFGRSGPWADFVALHSGVILLSGLASVTRDGTGRPRMAGSVYPDPVAGAYLALAIQQALFAREQTGVGCHIEVSMLDVLLTCMGGLIPGAANGVRLGPHSGRFLRTAEPQGFVAVSPNGPGADPGPDAKVSHQTRQEAMAELQEIGITAAAVLDMAEVMADRHLSERGFVIADNHPVAGEHPVPAVPWLYDSFRSKLQHAPCLGDHTEETLLRVANFTCEEMETLRADGVLS